jgi:N6-adenosine-specific RNA methylase IME4
MADFPAHALATIFPLIEGDELNALAADIRDNGLREPIVLLDGMILDGRNRYRACQMVSITPRYEHFDGSDPLAFVISRNVSRRHLSESQRAMVAARLANLAVGSAAKLQQPTKRDAVRGASHSTNVSERSAWGASKVLDKGTSELVGAVESGKVAVSVAAKIADLPPERQAEVLANDRPDTAIKKVAREAREIELAQKQAALPEKRYGVILADPPWSFETRSENGMDRAADNHYPTQSLSAIEAQDVASIAADDAVLFLWATAPMLPEALRVMAAWGFEYKSQFVWVKDQVGTGYWSRNQHELLLVGTKGNIPAPAPGTQWSSVIEAKVREHSRKPEQAIKMIEAYFPNLPKIELNCRGAPREGWDGWGLEAEAPAA